MKINSISNQTFGALMLEKKKMTPAQKFIVENATNAIIDRNYYINLFENRYSDIYISPNKDGKTVDVKILSAAGYTYNYIPQDEKGELLMNIHFPTYNPSKRNKQRMINNIKERIELFIGRCSNSLFSRNENPINVKKRDELEYISATDRASTNLQRKDLLPDAILLYGDPQVTTRDFVKNR